MKYLITVTRSLLLIYKEKLIWGRVLNDGRSLMNSVTPEFKPSLFQNLIADKGFFDSSLTTKTIILVFCSFRDIFVKVFLYKLKYFKNNNFWVG